MKFTKTAKAHWEGSLKEGTGHLTTQSGVLTKTPYSFKKRFEGEAGTNPEELVGAAHAGCFSMKLSGVLTEAGYTINALDTKAEVNFANGKIDNIHLILDADVDDIDSSEFQRLANVAKTDCPISQSLNTNISLSANLR